jgi:hypothetical protein
MNLIAEKSPRIKWYSDLRPFFSVIESRVQNYVWLWTDVEVGAPIPVDADAARRYWISGFALLQFVAEAPQFVWSVLSAIPPMKEQHARSIDRVPCADGNRNLWIGSPRPQHPDADFEVVCWDASCTLLIGADEEIAAAFRSAYPDALDLDLVIAQHAQALDPG